jgi:hypothetical protein
MENVVDNNLASSDFVLDNQSVSYLNETRKWTMFLSILGMITMGLLLVFAFAFNAILSSFTGGLGMSGPAMMMPGAVFSVVFFILILLYIMPLFYLYKFSSSAKRAIETKSTDNIQRTFEYQKSLYKYIGILTIVILSFYLLVFLIALFR